MIDIDKIKVLYASATTVEDKKMYQDILSKLGVVIPTSIPSDKPKVDLRITSIVKPKSNKVIIPNLTVKTKQVLEPQVNPIFQAVGILQGDVIFNDKNQAVIKVGDIEYYLLSLHNKKRKIYNALRKEIEITGISNQRVIVYPKITHFPSSNEPPVITFQLVGFINNSKENNHRQGIESQLKDFEFFLRGLWQFIPVCKLPCISIYKNFSDTRLEWVQEAPIHKQVKFMKSSHLPLIWKDPSTKPFRFIKNVKPQEKPYFVAVKAKFLPEHNVFSFVEELEQPLKKAPRFLKVSKELKAEALKGKPVCT